MAIGNNEDHEIPDENDEDYEDYEILDENNEDHEIVNKNNESMKRDEALNRKLKVFEVQSYAQTTKEEKCLAKNMRIAPLLKSKDSRKNINVIEESERTF